MRAAIEIAVFLLAGIDLISEVATKGWDRVAVN